VEYTELEPFLAPGSDLVALVEKLGGLTDKQRRALSAPVRDACPRLYGNNMNTSAHALMLLGCATGVRQIASDVAWLSVDREVFPLSAVVLRDRNPAWLADLPRAILAGWDFTPTPRLFVRAMVRAGLVAAPDLPSYRAGLARAMLTWTDSRSILQALDDDPEILDEELWQMLSCEGAGKALAETDKYLTQHWVRPGQPPKAATPQMTWQFALVSLTKSGRINRDRLLDETLTACLRDWAANDTRWHLAMHDALAPTLDEAASRQHVHCRLLAAGPGQTVLLAQRQLTRLLEAGRLDVPAMVEASQPTLSRADKGPVVNQLKLLREAAAQHGEHREQIAVAVAGALCHPRTDVQEQAVAILTELEPNAARRAALLTDRQEPLLRLSPGGIDGMGARVTDPPRAPMEAAAPEPVQPVTGPDELADLLGQLIEEADDPVDVERVLEATARLARERPRTTGDVLARRATALLGQRFPGPWSGEDIRADLAVLTLVWLTGLNPGRGPLGRVTGPMMGGRGFVPKVEPDWTLPFLVSLRIHEIARVTADGGSATLSLPTHRDGAIGAAAMQSRIRGLPRGNRPLPLDTSVAALRLDPLRRADLDLPAAHRTARALTVQLKALTGHRPQWEPVVGQSNGLYRSVTEPSATWRDAASTKGATHDAVAAVLDRRDPLRLLGVEAQDGEYGSRFEQVTALWPLLLPHHPELLAAHAHARLNRALDRNRSGTEPLLDALARGRTTTGPIVCSALSLGLSARNGNERTRAVDALVDLADSNHLDGHQLGEQINRLLHAGIVTGSRVASSLAEADRASAQMAAPVLDALQTLLPGLPGRRDALLFVDLAAQIAKRHGRTVELPVEFHTLRVGKSTLGLAAACRRVPVVPA
jgi:hypothetical protein